MKGVILAGGLGTRLYPLTHVTNKHLLPVYDKPMIYYPIKTLVDSGIDEVLIIVSGPHVGHFLGVLKNGKEFGLKHLEYAYQEKPDGGIADALALAKNFADNQPITVILGDNTTDADISSAVNNFTSGAEIFLRKVTDPRRYGVVEVDVKTNKVISIEEKPDNPKSDYISTGVYIFDNQVFDYIEQCNLEYSRRNELEITQVIDFYLKKDQLKWNELNGYWMDAGSFDSLLQAGKYWSNK